MVGSIPHQLESDEVGRFSLPHPQNPEKQIEMLLIYKESL